MNVTTWELEQNSVICKLGLVRAYQELEATIVTIAIEATLVTSPIVFLVGSVSIIGTEYYKNPKVSILLHWLSFYCS